jgi:hypothetical protein
MHHKSTSFRLRIKKDENDTGNNLKSAKGEGNKTKIQAKRVGFKQNKHDHCPTEDVKIKETFLSNTWRARIAPKDFDSIPGTGTSKETNSRDDENHGRYNSTIPDRGNSLYEMLSISEIIKSLGMTSNQETTIESKTSTLIKVSPAREKLKVSGKEMRKIYVETVEAIEKGQWSVFIKNINEYEDLVTFQPSNHDKMNLLHILASNDDIPDEIVEFMMKNDIGNKVSALKQVDEHGCTPLHYAASCKGQSAALLDFFLDSWPSGVSVRNSDGDLPLHIAVWAGKG